jgi:citrate synthase
MPSKWAHPASTGTQQVSYDFGLVGAARIQLNELLNEAARAHHVQRRGQSTEQELLEHATLLASIFRKHPAVTHRVYRSGDPFVTRLANMATKVLGTHRGDASQVSRS